MGRKDILLEYIYEIILDFRRDFFPFSFISIEEKNHLATNYQMHSHRNHRFTLTIKIQIIFEYEKIFILFSFPSIE